MSDSLKKIALDAAMVGVIIVSVVDYHDLDMFEPLADHIKIEEIGFVAPNYLGAIYDSNKITLESQFVQSLIARIKALSEEGED